MRYVYALKENNQIIYIGETGVPSLRIKQHTRPSGKFHDKDVEMEILEPINSDDRRESCKRQMFYQAINGLPIENSYNIFRASPKGGKVSSQIERNCPYCGIIIKGSSFFRWHGDNCKKSKA